ncbi:hypothetical protein C2G38_2252594 [Gigaspora rosea]|uniref:Alpha/Beta hydrolase protein n=1 Tax=Gigaspora rosea TaxID=44941 RepID=A0A397UB32_9GLOM|nr:hypothetical protein C2G38_2252594 [Gigaspora rosea]
MVAYRVSATSIALLQTKQRLSVIGIFGTNFELLRSVDNSESGKSAKRTSPEMPVRPSYRAPEITYRLFGFDKLGPSSIPYLQIHYWSGIEEALQKLGAKVVVTKGGLDCRYLITHLPTEKSIVRTLTTIATPHHGVGEISQTFEEAVKVVDVFTVSSSRKYCKSKEQPRNTIVATKTDQSEPSKASNKKSFNILISFNLPNFNLSLPNINLSNISLYSLASIPQTTYTILHPITRALIQAFDTPAYSNLTTDYCVNYFSKSTPNNPSVAYYSYGASTNVPIWSPLYFPYQIIKEKEGPNDGLVSVKSAQWGKYMRTVECDHWDLTNRWRLKIGSSFDPVEFYLNVATFLATEGY